ncbi:MAG: hypothetical protein HC865_13475 [Cyanobacteria bacterium RU_5_0]|nr:hypothetical protein [Cyanobacteria bacterium RU_5_0]
MDLVQDQVDVLNNKVDALQHTIEQFKTNLAEVLGELKSITADRRNLHHPSNGIGGGHYSYQSRTSFDSEMKHKDVLSDHNYLESETQGGERILTPEVQIQRLTAQLTAAYNRIAALEEQLLAKRIQ